MESHDTSPVAVDVSAKERAMPIRAENSRIRCFVAVAGGVVAVSAVAVAAVAKSSDPAHQEIGSAGRSSSQYYTAEQVTDACDALIGANDKPPSDGPDVTLCVARGTDLKHIEGLWVAVNPDSYASLSSDERATVALAFSERTGMPVSLRAGKPPRPT